MRGNAHVRFGGRVGETDQAERLEPRPGSTLPMMFRSPAQKGQVLVMSGLVMAFLFLPLSIFVIDTALVESGYAQLGETLQASAEDGASTIDEAAYRSGDGKTVALDPVQAKVVADRSMRVSGMPGLDSWDVTVQGSRVTITGRLAVHLLLLGKATLTESRSASLVYGQ